MNLKGMDFLTLLDFSAEEIRGLIDFADELKKKKKAGIPHRLCEGKNIALIFEKTSTRTRCAFEVAASDLGMGSTYLGPSGTQIGIKESIADTARVLAGMYDAIEYRGYGQSIVNDLAAYSKVPVINGLTNEYHPTQVLADLMTIREVFKTLEGIKLVYLGDARFNMGNSLLIGCAKMGMSFCACAPEEYMPGKELIETCEKIAETSGAKLSFESDPRIALKEADVVYTDIWVSMGEPEEEWEKRIPLMKPYQVSKELMAMAKDSAVFMHCLPSYHDRNTGIGKAVAEKYGLPDGIEVTNEVFESKASVVFQEAENRMHTIKAVIASVL